MRTDVIVKGAYIPMAVTSTAPTRTHFSVATATNLCGKSASRSIQGQVTVLEFSGKGSVMTPRS
jgi:hypothetical protein